MSPTGDLLVTLIFAWEGVLLSLLGTLRVLHWHGTSQAQHTLRGNIQLLLCLLWLGLSVSSELTGC